jgi:hypothetical protein
MKTIITLMFFLFTTLSYGQFYKRTSHSTIKTISNRERQRIENGYNLYERTGNEVVRRSTVWSTRKPSQSAVYSKSRREITAMSRQNQRRWKNIKFK